MKKVLFLGTRDKSDLVLYVALTLAQIGYKTAVVDCSKKKRYLRTYTNYTDKNELYDFFNIDIAAANSPNELESIMKQSNEKLESYDFVLVDIDNLDSKSNWRPFDRRYYVGDHDKINLIDDGELVNSFLQENEKEVEFNKVTYEVPSDVDEAYLNQLFNHKIKWTASSYELPFDEMDAANKINMQYNMEPTFKKLSKDYKKVITSIVTSIAGNHEKESKIAMKKMEKGDFVI
ncbi:hypothetical protein [Bacillus sp. AFS040349]|uniref:hypothetical protein n=1 Tax=Bacillus sp. AFS040349 TaxID=2033502 RepID=UPI000BFDB64C|nr:hypothetical protein [Bacillus sp. AFS040349]PGT83226.1 hypothetical protein COD11_12890 [Bacillus sp. AFS040349]